MHLHCSTLLAGGEPGTPMGGEGGGPSAQHLPWIPTLADLHQLDASVANRWGNSGAHAGAF